MTLAITDEHLELRRVARTVLGDGALAEARAALAEEAERLPTYWGSAADLGWFGLHVEERFGGQGFGLPEVALVLEAAGEFLAPGPLLSTLLASAILSAEPNDDVRAALLPGLADGSVVGAVGLHGSARIDGTSVDGDAGLVLGAGLADLLVIAAGDDMVVLPIDQAGVRVQARANLDPASRTASVTLDHVPLAGAWVLRNARPTAVRLGWLLAAAEAAGGARRCTEMAAEYAKVRVQFGRPIGTFQAVKHLCADMAVQTELATAVAWDAARTGAHGPAGAHACAAAAAVALPAFLACAKRNIQVHGGIGFTWEHDAHLFLRRAGALAAAFGPVAQAQDDLVALAAEGYEAPMTLDLPPEADAYREEVRAFLVEYEGLPEDERRDALVRSGYAAPHWPKPYGRDAGPVEQLVVDEELRAVARPNLGITGWVVLTIAQHGTPEQVERWVPPMLDGSLTWCQLFSEPGAGSDAAAISTKAVRVDGGWLVSGQKVWTSGAHIAELGFATVRTDPAGPKHTGITTMVIDMKSPGVEVRPLRELTGAAMFNEVFLDDVFVPDDDVVGPVDEGWKVARATLGNEKVSIGGGFRGATGEAPDLVPLLGPAMDDVSLSRQVGALLAEDHALRLLNLRSIVKAVAGAGPGSEGNVTKLVAAEHAQRVADLGFTIVSADGAVTDGPGGRFAQLFLFDRCLTIAGGTSEIVRNQIGERILGLPRDPLVN